MSTKKPCINYPSCTYTGKEQSPLRFGLSAEAYAINSVMEGHDKNLWIVEIKNNKKVWVKREDACTITPEEPLIKDTQNQQPQEPPPATNAVGTTISLPPIIEKKTTDYNLYLSYRLNQLKETNPDNDNKTNFAKVIEEWKNIKNRPDELKRIIEDAKQFASLKPAKKASAKRPSAKAKTTPEPLQAVPTVPEPLQAVHTVPEPLQAVPTVPEPTEQPAVELPKIKNNRRKVTKK
jgi:hypothetical protein